MIERITKETICERNLELLYLFEKLIFIPSFPDPNEREEMCDVVERVYDGWSECNLWVESGHVYGGIIIDKYSNIKSLEIIYIATDPEKRGKGIGKKLLDSIRNLYTGWSIYLEVDIPNSTNPFSYTRKKIWTGWGAREVPIHYIQPPLSLEKECVSGMSLMILDRDYLDTQELIKFLKEFYKGLDASDRGELEQMIEEVQNNKIIKLI